MSISSADYVTITSKDNQQFIIQSKLLPNKFPLNLPYSAKIAQKIVQYIHYKYMHQTISIKKLPNFQIQPIQALDVLKAAIQLGI